MIYPILKLLHIFFVVLFLGNLIIAVFWKKHGDRTENPSIMAHTMRGIIKSDKLFTMPGAAGILILGFGAMGIGGYSFSSPWILWSLILFLVSGGVFMAKIGKIQRKLLAVAEASPFKQDEYDKFSKQWDLWGTIATLAPIIAVILMVLKPV